MRAVPRSGEGARPAGSAAQSGVEPTLLYVIKQLELAIRARLDDLFRPEGMTALQYTALTVLERHPDLTSAQLARNSFVTNQSMADMVTVLEARGLIERHRDPADRRRLVIALTAAGRGLLCDYRDRVAEIETLMLAGIGDRQAAELRANILRCRANLAVHEPR